MSVADAVLYIHGKGGSAGESEHYKPLFPGWTVLGLDYRGDTPWEAGAEIRARVEALRETHEGVTLIANSVGAFFAMCSGADSLLDKAYFISPVVDMEKLIADMMKQAGAAEKQLRERGEIRTESGETLSWEYLSFVREHPVSWNAPTAILYGENDFLTAYETILRFSEEHGAELTVMKGGEHWFHTPEQMSFLDEWIKNTGARRSLYRC